MEKDVIVQNHTTAASTTHQTMSISTVMLLLPETLWGWNTRLEISAPAIESSTPRLGLRKLSMNREMMIDANLQPRQDSQRLIVHIVAVKNHNIWLELTRLQM